MPRQAIRCQLPFWLGQFLFSIVTQGRKHLLHYYLTTKHRDPLSFTAKVSIYRCKLPTGFISTLLHLLFAAVLCSLTEYAIPRSPSNRTYHDMALCAWALWRDVAQAQRESTRRALLAPPWLAFFLLPCSRAFKARRPWMKAQQTCTCPGAPQPCQHRIWGLVICFLWGSKQ